MNIPSPVQKIIYSGRPSIQVKRDDLIDPFISGNKWRKLKYLLETAQAQKKSHLVTFGGAYSNHLLATAAAAARFGYRSTAFVRGEKVDNHNLFLCRLFGMEFIFTGREQYRNKRELFNVSFGNDADAFFIDEGGASEEAVNGCAEIIDELTESYDYIFCAAGTGTTAAGLLRGLNRNDLPGSTNNPTCELHVVPVLKAGNYIQNEIGRYEKDLTRLHIHSAYHFGGYARSNTELLNFIADFTRKTGIICDHVYTAKMFYAIYNLLEKGRLAHHSSILAIHTGGVLGLLGATEKFNSL